MKELTLQEVLQIAGGLPDRATLDELSYREDATPLSQGQPIAGALPSPANET
jgi:hypothetical protein